VRCGGLEGLTLGESTGLLLDVHVAPLTGLDDVDPALTTDQAAEVESTLTKHELAEVSELVTLVSCIEVCNNLLLGNVTDCVLGMLEVEAIKNLLVDAIINDIADDGDGEGFTGLGCSDVGDVTGIATCGHGSVHVDELSTIKDQSHDVVFLKE
tara:strand:- start:1428 stop:1889 length:462 start_codon:yes stop_codon:yes gene_type:complete